MINKKTAATSHGVEHVPLPYRQEQYETIRNRLINTTTLNRVSNILIKNQRFTGSRLQNP